MIFRFFLSFFILCSSALVTVADTPPPASSLLPGSDAGFGPKIKDGEGKDTYRCYDLKTKIATGMIHVDDIFCFGLYISEFIIAISGSIAILLVMIGGYQYMIGSISGDKAQGIKTIQYSLFGMGIAAFAWIMVKVVETFFSS
jgi:hypothetical protein